MIKKRVLTSNKKGYVHVFIDGKKYRLHKWIMKYEI